MALRAVWREGYDLADFRRDLSAGLIVGIIALPLSMALAIASGAPPQYGLYTAIVAGMLVAIFGGSRVQVSGPTAAFVVILAPITAKFGLAGLLLATGMAGVIQIVMGITGMGRLIKFIPYTVTTGFTSGIAVVIATLQLKDFMGLRVAHMPDHYIERVGALARALPTVQPSDLAIGAVTLGVLIYWNRWFKRIPGPLVALALAGAAAWALQRFAPGMQVATIRSLFGSEAMPHGIPQLPPMPGWPWNFHGSNDAALTFSFETFRELGLAGFAIAMLGAIESLLSAVVADGMTGTEHDPDAELVAQGMGNLVAPFFGGFAATGAIARTSANVRFGARSPLAAVVHALFILGAVLLLAPLLGYLPMAALAALLLRVAWNMAEARHFIHVLRVAPRSDVAVLLTCFGLTVLFDMVVAVVVGVVLAALLFMQRMAELAGATVMDEQHHALDDQPMPAGVMVYEVAGPMFFGAAHKAMSVIRTVRRDTRIVVLDMRSVPMMDMTGLVNLASALDRLAQQEVYVIMAGVQRQPLAVMAKAHLRRDRKLLTVCGSFADALVMARMMGHLMVTEEPAAEAAAHAV